MLWMIFNGDAEKFYPKFYNVFAGAEAPFQGPGRSSSSLLLGFEVANHVLAHLSGSTFKDDVLTFKHENVQFTERQKQIIVYLGGYVVGTFYRRIRFSKKKDFYHKQCLSFLLACRYTNN